MNSIVVSLVSTIAALILAVPASYAMAFFPKPRTKDLMLWMLSTKMLPPVGVLVPMYLLWRNLNLLDTRTGLIIVYTLVNLPIVVWMLYTFFKEVPKDILEAGRMDGASPKQELVHLLMPLSLPGIASTALLAIILTWNEAFWSLNLATSQAAPLPTFIASFSSPEGLFWSKLSAASTMAVAPILIFGWMSPAPARSRPHLRCRQVTGGTIMATLNLRGIRKSYGDVEIIKGVDLDIADRDFAVFVGPSGCGKSTLLRMIAGLEEITSGDLLIDGVRVNDVPPAERKLAMVFQSYALYPHMSVRDNMGFALRLAGVSKEERRRSVEGRGEGSPARPAPGAQAEGAFGRAAAAGRHRPRHRPTARGVPLRRTSVQPRRRASRPDADRACPSPRAPERDDDLRHP